MSAVLDTERKFLRMLSPGTVLCNRHNDDWGCWLVLHAKVIAFVGGWHQLTVKVLESRRMRINCIEQEAEAFFSRWRVVHRP